MPDVVKAARPDRAVLPETGRGLPLTNQEEGSGMDISEFTARRQTLTAATGDIAYTESGAGRRPCSCMGWPPAARCGGTSSSR